MGRFTRERHPNNHKPKDREMRKKHIITVALALAVSTAVPAQTKAKAAAKKRPANTANAMSAKTKAIYNDMLENTQRIFFVDSMVIDKDSVLNAIYLPATYGKYIRYNDFFNTTGNDGAYVYVNGFQNKCFYTELGTDSISRLYTRDRIGGKWGEPHEIDELNSKFKDISYPFMASDGATLYFSGISDEGLGKRDIYLSKYDADEGKFLNAENIGLPFNSQADDFIFVEADADSLAWFATTRRQPDGKACVYTFVPPTTRKNYDADELPESKLHNYAAITRIRETWPTPEIRQQVMQHIEIVKERMGRNAENGGMTFVVNDKTTYHNASQFASAETRSMYQAIARMQENAQKLADKIEAARAKYHASAASVRAQAGKLIAQQEAQLEQSKQKIKKALATLRDKESNLLGE